MGSTQRIEDLPLDLLRRLRVMLVRRDELPNGYIIDDSELATPPTLVVKDD
jgi:hypothetical protein